MGFAGALRNGIAIGLGSIMSFFSGYGPDQAQNNLTLTVTSTSGALTATRVMCQDFITTN